MRYGYAGIHQCESGETPWKEYTEVEWVRASGSREGDAADSSMQVTG